MRVEVQDRMLEWRSDGNAEAWRRGARSSVGPEGHDYTRTAGDRANLEALGVDAAEVATRAGEQGQRRTKPRATDTRRTCFDFFKQLFSLEQEHENQSTSKPRSIIN
jgi:hypothetical protein